MDLLIVNETAGDFLMEARSLSGETWLTGHLGLKRPTGLARYAFRGTRLQLVALQLSARLAGMDVRGELLP